MTFARDDYASDSGARAIVAADFNRDGWVDVAHANNGRNSVTILMNQRGERFVRALEVPVGAGPFALATGDLDRNGIPDLAVANADGNSITILRGQSGGTFNRTDLAAPGDNPRGVAVADVNRDGRPDVIDTGYATGRLRIFLGDGAGGFTQGPVYTAAGIRPQGVAVGDLNHDGLPEFVIAAGSGLRVLQSIPGGGVVVAPTIGVQTNLNVVAVGDVNNDGATDVVAASTALSVLDVYLGDSTGRLVLSSNYAVGVSPRGLALADVNQDGLLDALTANRTSNNVSVLLNDPAHPGVFHDDIVFTSAHGSRALVAADFDHDGRVDVATGNELAASMTVLSNVTDFVAAGSSFESATVSSAEPLASEASVSDRFLGVPRIETADFDHDGAIDYALPRGTVEAPNGVVVLLHAGRTVVLTGAVQVGMTGFRVADFNGDGNPDVLTYTASPEGSPASTRFQTFLWSGDGFTPSRITTIGESVGWCSVGDLNRDARPDLVCGNVVLQGNGNGTFRSPVPYAPDDVNANFPGPILADLDRDGTLDVILANGFYRGNGAGGFTFQELTFGEGVNVGGVRLVADMNRDGWPDLIMDALPDAVIVAFGSADGFQRSELVFVVEDYSSIAVGDMDQDGNPDIVVNGSVSVESAGVTNILFGAGDGTFTRRSFTGLGPGPSTIADANACGLPDLAAYDAHAVRLLLNQHNETNHPPILRDYSITVGYPCVTLEARAMDPDQHALIVEWFDASGALITTGFGELTGLSLCVSTPGTYRFVRRASDGRGGAASGTVLFTYEVLLKEIVLYAAAANVEMTGNWSRVADPTAAGGMRAHDRNAGAPKVTQPSPSPTNAITIPFIADPNLTYKLWIRLKADGNSWANDSVWMQFTGAASAPYTVGTNSGLAVSLEECVNCGVSDWGWQDDGYGAPNKNGVLLQFDPGPQMIMIQTREDGVSIDQIVLSAERFLTKAPGPAKNDRTILPATRNPQ